MLSSIMFLQEEANFRLVGAFEYSFACSFVPPLIGYCMGKSISVLHGAEAFNFGLLSHAVFLMAESAWCFNWELHPEKMSERFFLETVADLVTTVAFVFFASYALSATFSPFRFKGDFFLESEIKTHLNTFAIATLILGWTGALLH